MYLRGDSMLFISHDFTDPYFNLASEEYLIKNFNDDIFMLWRNRPSIIVGTNQNTLAEINYEYTKANSIPVVRRLSGGGAVFHDLGNLNFTFISEDCGKNFNNFRKFTKPILDVLKQLNINAEFSGRNDLTIDGKKFSGNAEYSFKNRMLHHGTLLFSSDVPDMTKALKVNPIKFEGKGIKSVSSHVTNISSHLTHPITITEFRNIIMQNITNTHQNGKLYNFNEDDIKNINKLVRDKYSTWEWNYGNSPKYKFKNQIKYKGGNIEFNLNVEKGIITYVKIYGDFFSTCNISDIESALTGIKHNEADIKAALSKFNISDYFLGADINDITMGLINFKEK